MAGAVHERSERGSSARACVLGPPLARPLARPVQIWGVLNVTPDSFSDGGQHAEIDQALAHARRMQVEGADVIDVGGASSRPRGQTYGEGAATVATDEEIRRTAPVVEALVREGARVSIDTTSAIVAEAALAAGASIVNDVSMGASVAMLDACARHGAELVLMHTRGDGRVDASSTAYADVVAETVAELERACAAAMQRGVLPERLWIDPGLGFAKTAEQSMALLLATERLVATGHRVLIGASRKSFLASMAPGPDGRLAAPAERLGASIAAVVLAVTGGAHAVRVHDVHDSRQAALIAARRAEVS